MIKKQKGQAIAEYIVATAFMSLILYFALIGSSSDPTDTDVVRTVHDRQETFVESVLAP